MEWMQGGEGGWKRMKSGCLKRKREREEEADEMRSHRAPTCSNLLRRTLARRRCRTNLYFFYLSSSLFLRVPSPSPSYRILFLALPFFLLFAPRRHDQPRISSTCSTPLNENGISIRSIWIRSKNSFFSKRKKPTGDRGGRKRVNLASNLQQRLLSRRCREKNVSPTVASKRLLAIVQSTSATLIGFINTIKRGRITITKPRNCTRSCTPLRNR